MITDHDDMILGFVTRTWIAASLALVLAGCGGAAPAPSAISSAPVVEPPPAPTTPPAPTDAPTADVQATVQAAVQATIAAQPTAALPATATAVPTLVAARPTNAPTLAPTLAPTSAPATSSCIVGVASGIMRNTTITISGVGADAACASWLGSDGRVTYFLAQQAPGSVLCSYAINGFAVVVRDTGLHVQGDALCYGLSKGATGRGNLAPTIDTACRSGALPRTVEAACGLRS